MDGGRRISLLTRLSCLSAAYYYNLTFIQLRIIDPATRLVGLTATQVSGVMAGSH